MIRFIVFIVALDILIVSIELASLLLSLIFSNESKKTVLRVFVGTVVTSVFGFWIVFGIRPQTLSKIFLKAPAILSYGLASELTRPDVHKLIQLPAKGARSFIGIMFLSNEEEKELDECLKEGKHRSNLIVLDAAFTFIEHEVLFDYTGRDIPYQLCHSQERMR